MHLTGPRQVQQAAPSMEAIDANEESNFTEGLLPKRGFYDFMVMLRTVSSTVVMANVNDYQL